MDLEDVCEALCSVEQTGKEKTVGMAAQAYYYHIIQSQHPEFQGFWEFEYSKLTYQVMTKLYFYIREDRLF